MSIVGKLLETVTFDDNNTKGDGQDTTAGWNACPNVENLIVFDTQLRSIRALLESPKSSLKSIDLDFSGNSPDLKKSMDAFAAARVSSLESVTISCALPPGDSFDMLVKMNRCLRRVNIELSGLRFVEQDVIFARVTEIVACSLRCSTLEYLCIEEDSWLADDIGAVKRLIQEKYRHRRIHVSIFGITYSKDTIILSEFSK